MPLLTWARPGPVSLSMPLAKERMAHNLRFWRPGIREHLSLSRTRGHEWETFLVGASADTELPKALWIGYRYLLCVGFRLFKHRRAFTRGTDLPRNCLTLFCFQRTLYLFSQRSQNVEMPKARAQAKTALPPGLKIRGLRRAKARFVI
jgi:hypothetical protein